MSGPCSLEGRVIAVVGGDEREQEIARLAASSGASVRAFGFPWPEGGIPGVALAESAASALDGADYALFPIPGLGEDGALFAPSAPEPIIPDSVLLSKLADRAAIILGEPDERLRRAASALGIHLVPYERDEELMLLRGPAIVEGALELAIHHTKVTIHRARVVAVGHGTIGRLLARTLVLLGADVTVAARNRVQRADAQASGGRSQPLEELAVACEGAQMLFSTVPARVVERRHLERLAQGALVMDLAAPPGGVDLDAASALGHEAVWARGLGRRAPVTVGASQWQGILRRIKELETERKAAP